MYRLFYQSPVGRGQVGHVGRAAGAVAGCPTNPKCLAVPASEIVRLVLPSGLVLKHGVFDARGVHRCGCAAHTVLPKGIMVGSRACEEGLGDDRIRFNGKGWVAVSTTVVGGAAG